MNKKLKDEYTSLLEKLTINLIAQCDWYRTSDQKTIERTGVVYVINQVGTDNYKIGVSSNYTERLNHFGVKLPFDIKEVAVYETEDYFSKEKALHEMFSDKRLNGSEFFELTEEDLKEIDSFMTAPEEDIVSTEESLTDDVLVEEARELVKANGSASTSFLQRKLRIGYSRASRIIDVLEDEGMIGPADGAKPRRVFFEEEQGEWGIAP